MDGRAVEGGRDSGGKKDQIPSDQTRFEPHLSEGA